MVRIHTVTIGFRHVERGGIADNEVTDGDLFRAGRSYILLI